MMRLECFTRDEISGREMYLLDADRPEDIQVESPLCGQRFVCFLAFDASEATHETIEVMAQRLLAAGCVYICCWGPGSGRVHDVFDQVDIERAPDGPVVMSTWHEDESLAEALWFALFSAYPVDEYVGDCRSVLGLSVGSSAWAATMRIAMKTPKAFHDQILDE